MKLLALLLSVLLAIGMTACQKETPPDTSMEFNFETDCQFYMNTVGQNQLAESADGYYYLQDGEDARSFLRFIDKETLADTIVCAKPNCPHENQQDTSQCNACFQNHQGIHYFKGKLYIITAEPNPITLTRVYRLVEVSLDGTQRKNIWEMKWKTTEHLPNIFVNILHRGALYFTVFEKDTFPYSPMAIYSYDIETKKCILVENELTATTQIFAIGDYLYISAYNEEISDYSYYRYTISTKELSPMPQMQMLTRYRYGLINMERYDSYAYHYDVEIENRRKIELQIDSLRAGNNRYLCAGVRTITQKESGKTVTIEEYIADVGIYRDDMTEEEYLLYEKNVAEYEIIWSDYLNIYDAKTCELLGTVEYSDAWAYTFYLDDDWLIRYDPGNGFARIDLSKVGTEELIWQESEKVSGK